MMLLPAKTPLHADESVFLYQCGDFGLLPADDYYNAVCRNMVDDKGKRQTLAQFTRTAIKPRVVGYVRDGREQWRMKARVSAIFERRRRKESAGESVILLPATVPVTESKPRLLDLLCCAGGAARGYQRAGFHVTGVDINPQPRYAGDVFIQGDALEYVAKHGHEYDVIHASPPCQKFSRLNRIKKIAETGEQYPDLIGATRKLLQSLKKPYVIENVEGAPLKNPILLCGSQFGELKVYRHRIFESNILLLHPSHSPHNDNTPTAGKGVSDKGYVSITSGGIKNLPDGWTSPAAYKNMAMGIDWMTQKELTEAIPPAYTEFIGRQLMRHLKNSKALWISHDDTVPNDNEKYYPQRIAS